METSNVVEISGLNRDALKHKTVKRAYLLYIGISLVVVSILLSILTICLYRNGIQCKPLFAVIGVILIVTIIILASKGTPDTIDRITLTPNSLHLSLLDNRQQTQSTALPSTFSLSYVRLKYKVVVMSGSEGQIARRDYYVYIKCGNTYTKYAILISEADESDLITFVAFVNLLSTHRNTEQLDDNEIRQILAISHKQ
jgi:hypothetical protein